MPDITMCSRTNCPKSKKCYRHKDSGTKPFIQGQSFSHFGTIFEIREVSGEISGKKVKLEIDSSVVICNHFWQIRL